MAPLQRLEVEAVEDPAELAILEEKFRQFSPREMERREREAEQRQRPAQRIRLASWVGAVVVALLIGILIGRFLL
jgi:hypothetical protein